uniref:Cyclic nucleotide-binding domain-containing protein n=1 Tax=Macrostomum lignano TaxID=282301 RepID=A0A1I8F8T5_9PLAT
AIREIGRVTATCSVPCQRADHSQGEKGPQFLLVITGRVSVYVNSDAEQASSCHCSCGRAGLGAGVPTKQTGPEADARRCRRGCDLAFLDDANKLASHGEDAERVAQPLARPLTCCRWARATHSARSPSPVLTASVRRSVICDEMSQCYLPAAGVPDDRELHRHLPRVRQLETEAAAEACANSLHKEVYGYGEPIVQQGQKSGGLFFIVGCSPTNQVAGEHEESEKDEQSSAAPAATPAPAAAAVQAGLLRHRQGYQAAEQSSAVVRSEIALLGEGEILGQVELLASFRRESHNCDKRRQHLRLLAESRQLSPTAVSQRAALWPSCAKRSCSVCSLVHVGPSDASTLGQDPRIAGVPRRQRHRSNRASTDPVAAGEEQRQLQQQQRQAWLMHTRKQPPPGDLLWQHMLAMYVEGPQPAGPARPMRRSTIRHLLPVNAERSRRHLRERSSRLKLVASLQNEMRKRPGSLSWTAGSRSLKMWQQQQQQRRRTVPRSRRRCCKRELEASEKESLGSG